MYEFCARKYGILNTQVHRIVQDSTLHSKILGYLFRESLDFQDAWDSLLGYLYGQRNSVSIVQDVLQISAG